MKPAPRYKKGVSGNPATRFQKGQSGNPFGISKQQREFERKFYAALLDEATLEDAVKALKKHPCRRSVGADAIFQQSPVSAAVRSESFAK